MVDYEKLGSEISELLQKYIEDNGEVASAIMDVVKSNLELSIKKQFDYINDTQSAVAETVARSIQDGWKAAVDMNEALLGVSPGQHHFDSFLRVVRKEDEKEKK